jgi:hypothetical protein
VSETAPVDGLVLDVPDVPDDPGVYTGEFFADPTEPGSAQEGNGATKTAGTVRHTRKKPSIEELDLDPGPSSAPGDIVAHIRQLRLEFPGRSLRWIAKKVGQPVSFVRTVICDGSQPGGAR